VIAEGPAAGQSAAALAAYGTPDTEMRRRALRELIEAAIAELNEPYRTIVVMREIQGLAYEEIASGMDMPLGTIKVYLHRARRVLRDTVRREMGNDVL
jgi:RNA polymerase sigma-70 factor (ECF subfamily)